MDSLTNDPDSVPDYPLEGNSLYHIPKPVRFDQIQRLQLVISTPYTEEVIKTIHDEGGHAGLDKTYDRIRRRYSCDNKYKEVATLINKCDTCLQRQKTRTRTPM